MLEKKPSQNNWEGLLLTAFCRLQIRKDNQDRNVLKRNLDAPTEVQISLDLAARVEAEIATHRPVERRDMERVTRVVLATDPYPAIHLASRRVQREFVEARIALVALGERLEQLLPYLLGHGVLPKVDVLADDVLLNAVGNRALLFFAVGRACEGSHDNKEHNTEHRFSPTMVMRLIGNDVPLLWRI